MDVVAPVSVRRSWLTGDKIAGVTESLEWPT